MDETASAPAPQLVFELSDGIHHVLNQAMKPRSGQGGCLMVQTYDDPPGGYFLWFNDV